MRPKKVRTRRTTYVDDATISYATSYSKEGEESSFETWSRLSKPMVDRLPSQGWRLMRLTLQKDGVWKGGAGTRLTPAKADGQGIRTILQTFEALATELETRQSKGQSMPRQLHCKPQRPVADPTYSLREEQDMSVKICARSRMSRGEKNGRLHDLMHVTITAAQEFCSYHKRLSLGWKGKHVDLRAKKPSSSSLRLGAGNGAPGPSLCVGSRT